MCPRAAGCMGGRPPFESQQLLTAVHSEALYARLKVAAHLQLALLCTLSPAASQIASPAGSRPSTQACCPPGPLGASLTSSACP